MIAERVQRQGVLEAAANDNGSGAVVAVAMIAAVVIASTAVFGGGALVLEQQRLAKGVESAALAAADTVLGHHAGEPCRNAGVVAAAEGFAIGQCLIDGGDVFVSGTRGFSPLRLHSTSVAGASRQ